jgi:DNA-binding transcriptional ArsR family regulator
MPTDFLSLTFSALSDPTRRAILTRLSRGETSVGELRRPFKISAPSITRHLHVLERSGLISRSRRAQWRPCRLRPKPLKDAVDWLEHYRRHWEASLDRLENYLGELYPEHQPKQKEKKRHGRTKK